MFISASPNLEGWYVVFEQRNSWKKLDFHQKVCLDFFGFSRCASMNKQKKQKEKDCF